MKLIAVPMLKEESWCVRREFDNQLVACRLTQAQATAMAQGRACLKPEPAEQIKGE